VLQQSWFFLAWMIQTGIIIDLPEYRWYKNIFLAETGYQQHDAAASSYPFQLN
jgi:hypothetical protein